VRSHDDVIVGFETKDDTALSPGDYAAKTETRTVSPSSFVDQGDDTYVFEQVISVLTINDDEVEDDERFVVELTSLSAPGLEVTLPSAPAEITITDNDEAPVSTVPAVSITADQSIR